MCYTFRTPSFERRLISVECLLSIIMKKLLIIGAIALVVVGCVLAAGCTSTTTNTSTTTTEDFIVGTWTTNDGTFTYVITNDFKGAEYTSLGTKVTDFTWNKTTDGKYELIDGTGAKVIMTVDKNKGIMTDANGNVATKVLTGTSGIICG